MNWRKKVTVLSVVSASLALLYALLVIFSPGRVAARNTLYTWLDPKLASQADRIEIAAASGVTTLIKEDGAWFVDNDDELFPANSSRVEEMLALLSARGSFPVRAMAASAHDRLGLGDGAESLAVYRSDIEGAPLLELLAGDYDAMGVEVYYRRAGRDEVRSGKADILHYMEYSRTSWYNLRLFPEEIPVNQIDRITVVPPGGEDALVAGRGDAGWQISGLAGNRTDVSKIEPWVRGIVSAEGDDYVSAEDDSFSAGRIVIETGGRTLYIRLGEEIPPAAESQSPKWRAKIAPSDRVVLLSSWTVDRLFRNAGYFTLAEEEEED